jgi:mono/diheme cytochrome c family protein
MTIVKIACILAFILLPMSALAQDRDFTLTAPQNIRETGFLQYVLPRFSLKHGIRITQVDQGGDVVIGAEGVPVFSGLGTVWHVTATDRAGPALFVAWLLSDIGKRTIAGFQPDGQAIFNTEIFVEVVTPELVFDGDPIAGEALSLKHCGRCHVINDTNRMDGMGQTPSFALMRTFDDWRNRVATFYVLNPHPSFSQVAGITPPFDLRRPPAIVPLEITQGDIEAILAYVATIAPADLGAPLQSQ